MQRVFTELASINARAALPCGLSTDGHSDALSLSNCKRGLTAAMVSSPDVSLENLL